jgi:hypothetical protein
LHPDDRRDPTPRDAELDQYVDAFRLSSTRSRLALYVVIVATVLIGVTNYNIQAWSWPRQRIKAWFHYKVWDAQTPPGRPNMKAEPAIPTEIIGGNPQLLQLARDEYWKQFIARNAFTSSPIPGVSIDANDLGVLGGGALTLLMLVLLVCLMREHENLYLALYKVRQLARLDGHEHGTSEANLLYHALVMSQVLASPPTLARWRNRGILRHFGVIYLVPLGVHLWVMYTNAKTFDTAVAYVGRDLATRYTDIQWAIAICLAILTVLSLLNSRAMAQRWASAFKAINPVRNRLPQMSFLEWLRVPGRRLFSRLRNIGVEPLCQARTATEIVDTFRAAPEPENVLVAENVVAELENVVRKIKPKQLRAMTKQVCEKGIEAALQRIESGKGVPQLLGFSAKANYVVDGTWRITGDWTFRIRPEPERAKVPAWLRWWHAVTG